MHSILPFVGLAALLLLNALFVAAEFALVRARSSRLEQLAQEGKRGAALARRQLDQINGYLATCQVGITLASIAIGFVGEPTLGHLLSEQLGPVMGPGSAAIVSLALAYLIVTCIHITVGEQVPKLYALSKAESTARWLAGTMRVITWALKPMVWALDRATSAMLRAVGVNASDVHSDLHSAEDLRAAIAQSELGGVLDAGEATMLSGVFDLHEREARHAMTSIPQLTSVPESASAAQALDVVVESGHTRILVADADKRDVVVGVAHVADLLAASREHGEQATVAHALREVFIVPEGRSLDELLGDMRREHTSLAVVADEYGRAVGVITVEDILEEIVGEIEDETDEGDQRIRPVSEGVWEVDGHVSIIDLADEGVALPDDTTVYASVAGLVFDRLGHLPKDGEQLRVDGYELTVLSVQDSRIATLRLERVGADATTAGQAAAA